MSQTDSASFLLDTTRGTRHDLGAFVVAARFSRDSRHVAFALGDGSVQLVALADRADSRPVTVHDGAVLALAADTSANGFVSGGDDGGFRRIGADGTVSEVASFGMKWVEQVASFADEKGKGSLLACSVGKLVHLFNARRREAEGVAAPLLRHRPGVRCQGQADRRIALQRRLAVVRRCEDRQPAQAGMEGQPYRASPSIPTATRW